MGIVGAALDFGIGRARVDVVAQLKKQVDRNSASSAHAGATSSGRPTQEVTANRRRPAGDPAAV